MLIFRQPPIAQEPGFKGGNYPVFPGGYLDKSPIRGGLDEGYSKDSFEHPSPYNKYRNREFTTGSPSRYSTNNSYTQPSYIKPQENVSRVPPVTIDDGRSPYRQFTAPYGQYRAPEYSRPAIDKTATIDQNRTPTRENNFGRDSYTQHSSRRPKSEYGTRAQRPDVRSSQYLQGSTPTRYEHKPTTAGYARAEPYSRPADVTSGYKR